MPQSGNPWLAAAQGGGGDRRGDSRRAAAAAPGPATIATRGIQEIFTAAALLVVIGVSLLMVGVGLSMSLGAFLAGVLLADSEYRHELEADIEPFKGLLLGLFFISVGMSVDLGLIVAQPLLIVGAVVGLMAVKAAILLGIGRAVGHQLRVSRATRRCPVPGRRVRLRAVRPRRRQPRHGRSAGRPAGGRGDAVHGGHAAGAGPQRRSSPPAAQPRAGKPFDTIEPRRAARSSSPASGASARSSAGCCS